jgi:hypothetical protein
MRRMLITVRLSKYEAMLITVRLPKYEAQAKCETFTYNYNTQSTVNMATVCAFLSKNKYKQCA